MVIAVGSSDFLSIQKKLLYINFKLGLLKFLQGIDYYRMIEYPVAYTLLRLETKRKMNILDVGSSDSIFPLLLALSGHNVVAIDIDPKVKRLEEYARRLKITNIMSKIQDVTQLAYPNKFFDRVTAISTIEHVLPLDDGDIKAMKEIGRVLKPGGLAVITVPYEDDFSMEWRYHPRYGVYLRRGYDEEHIYKRLVEPSGLKLEDIFYFCDDKGFYKIWYKGLVFMLNPLTYFVSNVFLKIRRSPRNAKGAIIVLSKGD
jgi:SAM-dependent methyltransferase